MSSWLTKRIIFSKYLARSKKCAMFHSNTFSFTVIISQEITFWLMLAIWFPDWEKGILTESDVFCIFYLMSFKSSWIPQIFCITNKYDSQIFLSSAVLRLKVTCIICHMKTLVMDKWNLCSKSAHVFSKLSLYSEALGKHCASHAYIIYAVLVDQIEFEVLQLNKPGCNNPP